MLISEQWPKLDKELVFEEEAKTMDLIHEIIVQIRSIRAELKVEPARKIHAHIYGGKYTEAIESKRDSLMRLARLESLEISEKGKKIENSKPAFIDEIEVYLPLKDMIDSEKEKKRITKEIDAKNRYIKGLDQKLKNKGFLANAPAEVVEKNQKKLDDEIATLKKLEEQLKSL